MKTNLAIKTFFYMIFVFFIIGFAMLREYGTALGNAPLSICGIVGLIISAGVLSWMLLISPQFSIVRF